MKEIVDQDGKPFNPGLLSISEITREAFRILEGTMGKDVRTFAEKLVSDQPPRGADIFQIAQLRRSCGADPEKLSISINVRKPLRFNSAGLKK
jgi:hypothetical protein